MDEKYTKYEMARILGARALQISMGAPFLIKISEKDLETLNFNPVEIAKKEFEKGIIPITVKRPYPVSHDYQKSKEAK
jgi:DNA-directed RNA polymerase subunit K